MKLRLMWYVTVGGAIGSDARFALRDAIQSRLTSAFPVATLAINVTGSLLLGFIYQIATDTTAVSDEVRVFLGVGLCGGFTTFSTFSYETARLMQDGNHRQAGAYIMASVVMSLL